MPWMSVAASVGSSLIGGLMGGSKEGERDAKDAAALGQYEMRSAKNAAKSELSPFASAGQQAERELAYLLGTGGYDVPMPTLEDSQNELRRKHFLHFGSDYTRNSNMGGEAVAAKFLYDKAMKDWQKGFDQWKTQQTGNSKFGSLLDKFSQEDLDNDVVYQNGLQFGLDTGTKAIDARARASGSMGSGRVLKDLLRFGNDYGTTKANDSYVRNAADKDRVVNYLGSQASRGLGAVGTGIGVATNAANNSASTGINTANSVANLSANRQQNQQDSLNGLLTNLLYTYKNENSRQYRTPDFNPNVNNWGTTV
jgi:hypothetical protein